MSSPSQLSFLPDDYLAQKQQRRTNVICALLFMAVIGGIGSAFTLTERSMRDIQLHYTEVEQQYTEAAKRIEQVRTMQEQQRRMAHQAELTASLIEKVPRSFLLAEITNALPGGVSLLDFTLDSKRRAAPVAPLAQTAFDANKADTTKKKSRGDPGSPVRTLPEPKLYDIQMKLTGVAPTDVQVAGFIKQLGESKLFKEVNLVVSDQFKQSGDTTGTNTLRKFTLEVTLARDAKVTPEDTRKLNKTAAVELNE